MVACPVIDRKAEGNAAFLEGAPRAPLAGGTACPLLQLKPLVALRSPGDFAAAEAAYTAALGMCRDPGARAVLHSNRAAARLELGSYAAALEDARLACVSDPGWDKARSPPAPAPWGQLARRRAS